MQFVIKAAKAVNELSTLELSAGTLNADSRIVASVNGENNVLCQLKYEDLSTAVKYNTSSDILNDINTNYVTRTDLSGENQDAGKFGGILRNFALTSNTATTDYVNGVSTSLSSTISSTYMLSSAATSENLGGIKIYSNEFNSNNDAAKFRVVLESNPNSSDKNKAFIDLNSDSRYSKFKAVINNSQILQPITTNIDTLSLSFASIEQMAQPEVQRVVRTMADVELNSFGTALREAYLGLSVNNAGLLDYLSTNNILSIFYDGWNTDSKKIITANFENSNITFNIFEENNKLCCGVSAVVKNDDDSVISSTGTCYIELGDLTANIRKIENVNTVLISTQISYFDEEQLTNAIDDDSIEHLLSFLPYDTIDIIPKCQDNNVIIPDFDSGTNIENINDDISFKGDFYTLLDQFEHISTEVSGLSSGTSNVFNELSSKLSDAFVKKSDFTALTGTVNDLSTGLSNGVGDVFNGLSTRLSTQFVSIPTYNTLTTDVYTNISNSLSTGTGDLFVALSTQMYSILSTLFQLKQSQ